MEGLEQKSGSTHVAKDNSDATGQISWPLRVWLWLVVEHGNCWPGRCAYDKTVLIIELNK